jgi:hypothetical protein
MINNTSYGTGALQNNTSGTNDTAIGAYSAYNNTDGSNNTAVGSNTAFFNTTGSNNTSLGAGSLCNNTTGSLNTAIGSSALEGLTGSVGNQNTAVGVQALYTNQGDQNTAIGAYSALGVTGGNYNTFLGANSSTLNNTSYSYSTAIGYNALIDASNQIMIGGTGPNGYPNVIIPGKAFLPNFDILTVQNDQIVPKSYVDTVSQGLSPKGPVQAATTSTDGNIGSSYSLPLGTISGVSNTLTLDGVLIFDGSAVLIKNQTDASANGIYIYDVLGGGPSTSTLTRSPVLPVGSDAVGAFTLVLNGDQNGGKLWIQSTPPSTPGGPVLVGTDPLNFIEYYSFNYKLGEGLNFSPYNGETYLNVDSSLNFINFIDSNSSAYTQPGGALASGILALGTNTTNKIVIGPTGTSVPIQAQSIIQAQQGITGPTGSFNNLYVTNKAQFVQDISVNTINIGLGGGGQSGNIAIGAQTLQSNTTGTQNVAIGYQSLQGNTGGSNNTAVGYQSLFNNTTGDQNTALGVQSLYNNTTGYDNVAVGYQSMFNNNNTGYSNTALGVQSLYDNTTGYDNTAVGYQSMLNNTTGNSNTAVGFFAMYGNTGGTYNTALGFQASFSGNYSYSTAIGANAQPTSSNQIMLGGLNSGVYPQVVAPGGITGATGSFSNLTLTNATVTTTGGSSSGFYLQISINSTTYYIPLYSP